MKGMDKKPPKVMPKPLKMPKMDAHEAMFKKMMKDMNKGMGGKMKGMG